MQHFFSGLSILRLLHFNPPQKMRTTQHLCRLRYALIHIYVRGFFRFSLFRMTSLIQPLAKKEEKCYIMIVKVGSDG